MTAPTIYEPHRHGIPSLRAYSKDLWGSRHLAFDLARTEVKADHQNTLLGQIWQLLNPLLLAFAYLFIFEIIAGGRKGIDFLAFLLSGLFVFYFTRTSLVRGSNSVVSGGAFVTNTRMPRAVLPATAVMVAFRAFLPSILVYVPFHILADFPVSWSILSLLPVVVMLFVFNYGLAMLFAALSVYFRDIRTALPFVVRIWLYVSPVLYTTHEVPERLRGIIWMNPLSPFLQAFHDALGEAAAPTLGAWAAMVAWSVGTLFAGAYIFMWREREFAVRL